MVDAFISKWVEDSKTGEIRVFWEDGHSQAFRDRAHVTEYVADVLDSRDIAEKLALAIVVAKAPQDAKAEAEGKRVTLDLAGVTPVAVTREAAPVDVAAGAEVKP